MAPPVKISAAAVEGRRDRRKREIRGRVYRAILRRMLTEPASFLYPRRES